MRYDARLLGDGGGGDVSWWHDYIRVELERSHDFYTAYIEQLKEALELVDDTGILRSTYEVPNKD